MQFPLGCILFIVFSIISTLLSAKLAMEWIQMEVDASTRQAGSVSWGDKAPRDVDHEVTFYLESPNKDKMEKILQEVSDPSNPKYGKHLSHEEVVALSKNEEGERLVLDYLTSLGDSVHVTKQTTNSISASAPIATWERAFNTEFFQVTHKESIIHRAKTYYLPSHLVPHVTGVMNTIQMPVTIHHGPIITSKGPKLL